MSLHLTCTAAKEMMVGRCTSMKIYISDSTVPIRQAEHDRCYTTELIKQTPGSNYDYFILLEVCFSTR